MTLLDWKDMRSRGIIEELLIPTPNFETYMSNHASPNTDRYSLSRVYSLMLDRTCEARVWDYSRKDNQVRVVIRFRHKCIEEWEHKKEIFFHCFTLEPASADDWSLYSSGCRENFACMEPYVVRRFLDYKPRRGWTFLAYYTWNRLAYATWKRNKI